MRLHVAVGGAEVRKHLDVGLERKADGALAQQARSFVGSGLAEGGSGRSLFAEEAHAEES